MDLFRSLLPLYNPIGFGAADFLLLTLALLLFALVLLRARFEPAARRLAEHTGWCMLVLAALPMLLRLALLPPSPAPTPAGADDFAYLLLADTLRHLRLANPAHPMRQFFEAVFVLQEPSYSSIFPLGQGIVLALGWTLLGHPWAGVVLSTAAFCALCYWMLRGWVSPGWALVGGLLAVMEFGPLCEWMNLYWGGALSAAAGCLVFGAIPRLDSKSRVPPILLGCGLALAWLTRPFESTLLAACLAPLFWRRWRQLAIVAVVMLPALGLTLLHNRAVTGRWTTLPYQLSRYQYGVPASFTFQQNPVPHRSLTAEQELDYQAQCIIHGDAPETPRAFLDRWVDRIHFYRFFLYAPLFLALPAFLAALWERRYLWVAGTLAVLSLGTNFYPYFYPHYIAAATCLFVLVSVVALERLTRWKAAGATLAGLLLSLCAAHFLFWYSVHAFAPENMFLALGRYETWDFINYGDAGGRIAINRQLAAAPGKQLVFVRYSSQHAFHEWIHNDADIDRARVVWAGDLGPEENEKLRRFYPDRSAWLVEPDARPPRLSRYAAEPEPAAPEPLPVTEAPAAEPDRGPRPPLRFEDGSVNNPGAIREMRRKPRR
ncbi:MAG TPA: hypothetical protein VGS58_00475 [Candidatus Sulfopaludibacter sp.]|nr:hypothetical protein [Candidatus Sulfopaludibacter sp.]